MLMAIHNKVGELGESIASDFLRSKGLKIITKNYRKPYGEIDIVAHGNKTTRFIEVKSVSYGTKLNKSGVSGETYRPEENVHKRKLQRLARVIEAYVLSNAVDEWVFDVVVVYIDARLKRAQVKWIKDIIIGS